MSNGAAHISAIHNIAPMISSDSVLDKLHQEKIPDDLGSYDDADLWGILAAVMEENHTWPDSHCKDIIQAFIKICLNNDYHHKLHHFWQRWSTQHRELRTGLQKIADVSWQDKCRFCEVWSANRPTMSPFSGVAEILLKVSDDIPALDSESRTPDQVISSHAGSRRCHVANDLQHNTSQKNSEIIVVTTPATMDEFTSIGASRQLLRALRASGYSWSLCEPWDPALDLDPKETRGVIFWSYRHRHQDYVYHAIDIEKKCNLRNIPVINSIIDGWDTRHSTILRKFSESGIRSPKYQKFTDIANIRLNYPLILRVDGLHRGQEMFLVQSPDEASELMRSKQSDFLNTGKRDNTSNLNAVPTQYSGLLGEVSNNKNSEISQFHQSNKKISARAIPPPNLAIEFISVKDKRGHFNKRRALIVGDQLIPRHCLASDDWLVNFDTAVSSVDSRREHLDYINGNETDIKQIVDAGKSSGSDITAIDYSVCQNGDYIFWECNRLFGMSYDFMDANRSTPSAKKLAKRAERDDMIGDAMQQFINNRLT